MSGIRDGHDGDEPEGDGGLCPVCGSPLTPGAQFCGACGSHVPSPLVPYDAPTTPDGPPSASASVAPTVPGRSGLTIETSARCPSCGAVNAPDAERCALCGASLVNDPAESRWPSGPGRNGNQP
jgi:predicted amidophosphoribosyltransferase